MRIDLVYPVVPPRLDAIGQYTARQAAQLAQDGARVRLLTSTIDANPIDGVSVEIAYTDTSPVALADGLRAFVAHDPPDWLLLQYNPFSYGRRGLNLHLPRALAALKRERPALRLATMFHETFVPVFQTWKSPPMAAWQRWMFRHVLKESDIAFFSIEPWVDEFRRRFPRQRIVHLPVASNMPRVAIGRAEARARLNIPENVLVVGLFGTAHISRMLPLACAAVAQARKAGMDARMLYIGPDGDAIRPLLDHEPISLDGPLPEEEVSRRFAAMDVYLVPFFDGVSTRRTSMMTALQHGVATAATRSHQTDRMLLDADGHAMLLSAVDAPGDFVQNVVRLLKDIDLRMQLQRQGQAFYERHFGWNSMSQTLREALA